MLEIEAPALVATLRTMFGLPADADPRLSARIKHMQREGFPSRKGVGQGHRHAYGAGDVLRLALAFQLVDCGLSSVLAVELVDAHWATLGPLLARAASGDRGTPFAAITPHVIVDVSRSAKRRWADGGCQEVARASRLRSRARGTPPSPAIAIDPVHLVGEARRSLTALPGVGSYEVDAALLAFASPESREESHG